MWPNLLSSRVHKFSLHKYVKNVQASDYKVPEIIKYYVLNKIQLPMNV